MIRSFTFITFYLLSVGVYAKGSMAQAESIYVTNQSTALFSQASPADIITSLEKANKVKQPPSPMFSGSAELGLLYKTGNTKSGDMKTGIDLRWKNGAWLSLLNIDLLLKKADVSDENNNTHFKTTDKKSTITSQTNYSINNQEKNYIYGNIWFEENDFSSFINQNSISTGWGRHWYKTTDASLWGDIGPGYKRDLFKATDTAPEQTDVSWIIQAQAVYIRKLGEHVELKQFLSAKQALKASDNSIYKAVTTLTTKLISTLQLKFTFSLDYNSEVELDKKNLDSQTAVTLVYSF
ncbi:hypothetical protein NBRC116592_20030 [Colwellia sp. KU-HH00111]|uniref:DUF481 domain-containing protein n=1 Tax=Colwellia sp. KU-HH00111 TaxID=3127652 RepID=UPI0031024EBC